MAQILVPVADLAAGSWTTTPLWSKVDDDSTVNPSGDGTTITSADNSAPDNADLDLATGTDPASSTGHILRARWNKSASGGHAINAVLELWQGTPGTGTLIATLSVTGITEVEQESTYTLSTAEADSITDYAALNLRVSRQGDTGGNPSTRRSLVVDLVELEIPDGAAAQGRLEASWAEVEAPDTGTRFEASWAEVEAPDANARMDVSWAEFESPETPTRIEASWAEFEAEAPTHIEASWATLETPDTATGFQVSWAEVEAPSNTAESRVEVSWAELESPETPTNFEVSWAEVQTPSPARLEASWAELETPDATARAEVSWAEMETGEAPSRLEVSWAEFAITEASATSAARLLLGVG